ncbi:hypothetical protein [Halococcus sp. IIIV-5B]|uniref:hypothetical protein n=1 Tax=Halococcus sp. IIIV-5B TaxID=2321230 RepID=UPI000E7551B3|nr:hypothetical protein [Halococcus sp. IIIV-5B]RJT06760.1 hypothetical protein D3261_04410 [Halococcus sp. IIIV-5B]
MAVPSHQLGPDTTATDDHGGSRLDHGVSVHTTRPGRRVFVEAGNTDGWIATDLAVDLER